MSRGRKWTDEEVAALLKLKTNSMPLRTLALRLGRTTTSITEKLRLINMTQHDRQKRRDRINMHRYGRYAMKTHHIVAAPRPAPDALAERDIRLSIAPRDLTAVLLGDPLPGYSALDRRQRA